MKKKVLFSATVDFHFKAFHLPYLKWFKEQGWEVHIAAFGNLKLPYVDKKFDVSIQRSPFKKENLTAYKELKKIIEENDYKIIHCHTPMGGVLSRLAAIRARKNGTKVIYTAHGFHFCKGAPVLNWLLYYPIERLLASQTDCLITINNEDYSRATAHKFKAEKIKLVHGVGVDTELFAPVHKFHKSVLRAERGYSDDDFLMLYAAEFNKNKNQKLLIESLALIKDKIPSARLLLAGDGPMLVSCKHLAINLGINDKVDFLGLRSDIGDLLKMSDLAVASSLREGLPVNIMEAMACALPVVATENRGHRELIQDGKNGWLITHDNPVEFTNRIMVLAENETLRRSMGLLGRKQVMEKNSVQKVLEQKAVIYETYMEELEDAMWAVH